MYSKLYYGDRVLPVVRERLAAGPDLEGPLIKFIKDITRELFAKEDDETKAIVAKKWAVLKDSPGDDEESGGGGEGPLQRTPEQYQRYVRMHYFVCTILTSDVCSAIDELPVYLNDVLDTIGRLTGLSGSIILGGPMPKANRAISSLRYVHLVYISDVTMAYMSTVCIWVRMLSGLHLDRHSKTTAPPFLGHFNTSYAMFIVRI